MTVFWEALWKPKRRSAVVDFGRFSELPMCTTSYHISQVRGDEVVNPYTVLRSKRDLQTIIQSKLCWNVGFSFRSSTIAVPRMKKLPRHCQESVRRELRKRYRCTP